MFILQEYAIESAGQPAARRRGLLPDLAVALSDDPALVGAFGALSVSRRKALVLPILQAKGADTRQRRVLKAVDSLRTSAS